MPLPRSGDVLRITKAASVQFSTPMLFRVIRVHDWPTYDRWAWLDGYELDESGDAVERRSIFVQVDGLHRIPLTVSVPRSPQRPVTPRASGRRASPPERKAPPK